MGRVLNLLLCLEEYNDYDAEIALLKSIHSYLVWIYCKNIENPNSKEVSKKTKWR